VDSCKKTNFFIHPSLLSIRLFVCLCDVCVAQVVCGVVARVYVTYLASARQQQQQQQLMRPRVGERLAATGRNASVVRGANASSLVPSPPAKRLRKRRLSCRESGDRPLILYSRRTARVSMMAATDVTYLFFQRDTGTADNGPLSPVVKTTRVVQHPLAGTVATGVRRPTI